MDYETYETTEDYENCHTDKGTARLGGQNIDKLLTESYFSGIWDLRNNRRSQKLPQRVGRRQTKLEKRFKKNKKKFQNILFLFMIFPGSSKGLVWGWRTLTSVLLLACLVILIYQIGKHDQHHRAQEEVSKSLKNSTSTVVMPNPTQPTGSITRTEPIGCQGRRK